ncbi:toxin-activating lysine-acyltransferase [Bradyrhizobium sp. HKCCYLRH3099]|uniref:toxin-activating lysine-acyltransferase n=1 Tax=unclassified Bradyrhizobium TaxID=2631580 RepID=UPI003EC06795
MLFGKRSSGDDAAARPTSAERINGASVTEPASAAAHEGKPPPVHAALPPEEIRKRMIASKQMAAAFGEIVTLLMRSPRDKHQSLADLEWLVVPAIVRGQYALADAQSKDTGATAPVAAVLWALVSEEVDQRLSDLSTPLRLKPDEWRSGNVPWIIHAAGDAKVLAGLIQRLPKAAFEGRQPKMRMRGTDGKLSVGHLEVKQTAAGASQPPPARKMVDA